MKYSPLLMLAVLAGCASNREDPPADVLAIQDYIAVAELEEVDKIRTSRDAGIEKLGNRRYVFLKARRNNYLIEFGRDCWALLDDVRLANDPMSWDQRHDANYLRPRMDTIRGCRIGRAFEVNDGQIEEIRNLGEAPTGG